MATPYSALVEFPIWWLESGNEKRSGVVRDGAAISQTLAQEMNQLPEDLQSFLQTADSLEIMMEDGEVRKAELLPLDELKIERFRVESEDFDDEGEAEASEEFEGYSLLKSADGYSPHGVLVWLTKLNEFGAWDCDHLGLITFPGVSWSEIIASPTWFINGQWYPDRIAHRKVSPTQAG